VLMSNLRKKGIITDNGIHPRLVPNLRAEDGGCFQFLILIKDDIIK
jgi:hypothetical protein